MKTLLGRYRVLFLYAGIFSFFVNILLIVPALYMLQVFDRVLTSRSLDTLLLLTAATAGALLVMAVLDVLRARLLTLGACALEKRIAPRVLGGLLRASPGAGAGFAQGMRDLASVRAFASGNGIIALFDLPWLPLYLFVIFLFHPLLGIVATAGTGLLVGLAWVTERASREPIEDSQGASQQTARLVDASLRNGEVVSAMGMSDDIVHAWQVGQERVHASQARTSAVFGTMGAVSRLARQALQVAMLAAGAWLVVAENLGAGVMMAGTVLLGRALAPVESLVAGWKSLTDARHALGRLVRMVQNEEDVRHDVPLPERLSADLRLEHVSLAAPGRDRPLLRDIAFELAEGESLGIVGPSGAGKSALARIVAGAWRPTVGTVRLGGTDVSKYPREAVGRLVGYAPQEAELFEGSVGENISRMRDAPPAAVAEAARLARVHERILQLPQGYDTPVGPGGRMLPAGLRRSVALARALFGSPRLVVLDEPNAHMDGEGEDALQAVLQALREARVTTIVVTHRPSVLSGVDRMLVLGCGSTEMFGTRTEVLARLARQAAPQVVVAQAGARRASA